MNYFPNIDKLISISNILQFDTNKSKLEYTIYLYLTEDYKVFDNSKDYWITATMIATSLSHKDFAKLIKKQSQNFICSKIDQVIVDTLLRRSSETPKKRASVDSINPDFIEDEPFRIASE
jgi:hypothetical protein